MEELERIIEALKNGETTFTDDWQAVAEYYSLKGETDAETITNIEKFVLDNFPFEAAAENPYVYFGTDGNANIWQCVDGICKDSANNAVYISSTDAGILFNDSGFYAFLKENITNKTLFDNIYAEVDGRVVYGLDGNDELSGEFRNSVLIGGKDNDTLRGDLGEDIYVFSRGDGIDSIYEKAYIYTR